MKTIYPSYGEANAVITEIQRRVKVLVEEFGVYQAHLCVSVLIGDLDYPQSVLIVGRAENPVEPLTVPIDHAKFAEQIREHNEESPA